MTHNVFISHALPLTEEHKRRVNLHHVIPLMDSTVDISDVTESECEGSPDVPDAPARPVPDVPAVPSQTPPTDPADSCAPKLFQKRARHVSFLYHTSKIPMASRLPMASDLPPPPRNLPEARRHLFSKQWRQAYAEEK